MLFFSGKRRRQKSNDTTPKRAPLVGVVTVGNRTWTVREEKRQGPRPQILILNAEDDPASEMHVRPNPGQEIQVLEDVAGPATDPSHRWFCDSDGQRWEARMVQSDEPTLLIKFICWGVGVFEGQYPFRSGLGALRDDELRQILLAMQEKSPPPA